MDLCEGCGYEYEPDEMAVVPTTINLRDGTQRQILFCDCVCPDFWDESLPGDWVPLHSGGEVQLADWECALCGGAYPCSLVQLLVDTDDFDLDDPIGTRPQAEDVVCRSCQRKRAGSARGRRWAREQGRQAQEASEVSRGFSSSGTITNVKGIKPLVK
jgi:hypothetical protein